LGSIPLASRIIIGVDGLFFFIVGYARFKNVLCLQYHIRFSMIMSILLSYDSAPDETFILNIPCSFAVSGGLAEKESEFLDALVESVFGGHWSG
jgi:hypothetical protein